MSIIPCNLKYHAFERAEPSLRCLNGMINGSPGSISVNLMRRLHYGETGNSLNLSFQAKKHGKNLQL